jgi:hypothetical protein
MLVRSSHLRPTSRGFPSSAVLRGLAGCLALALTSCSLFGKSNDQGVSYNLPLTVQLRPAPSVAAAQVAYQNACGQTQSLPIGPMLQEAIAKKSGRVFVKVIPADAGNAVSPDGYLDVAVGLTQVDLVILRKGKGSYPATVAIGLDFAYTAADGTVLYSKKLQSLGRNDVDAAEISCEVKGLDKVVQEAIGIVTDGMAKQLGTSPQIIVAAEARRTGGPRSAAAAISPPSPIRDGTVPSPAVVAGATAAATENDCADE